MNKRALMLTAATVALLSGQTDPASATTTPTCTAASSTATLCDITTVVVTPLATSTVQTGGSDITIETTGSIAVTTSPETAPALKIDSNNNVTNFGTISYKGVANAVGVQIDAGTSSTATTTTGSLNGLLGTIDLTGAGTGKTGVLVELPTGNVSGTFNGGTTGIGLGTIKVTGDNSFGLHILSGVTLDGNLTFAGADTVTSSTTTAGNSTGVVGAEIDGNIVGNIVVSQLGGSIVATGAGSRGLVVLGNVTGDIFNGGGIEAAGVGTSSSSSSTKTSTTGNPMGGSAFVLAGSVSLGITNAGPISAGDGIAQGIIATQGTGPAVYISPSAGGALTPAPLNIGVYTADANDPGYSFYNRGQISATPNNVDTGALAMHVVGAVGTPVNFEGLGIFNSGRIAATAATDNKATNGVPVTGLWIDDYVNVPELNNSSEPGTGTGNILASISGASPGQAIALLINTNASLPTLINSGTIGASVTSSDLTISGLSATAIFDKSGTLNSIDNSGTISATTTTLQNNSQVHVAANLQANTSGINFQDTGQVIGDVFFGSGNDVLNVSGTGVNGSPASVIGNLSFYGGHDSLSIGDNNSVIGAVLERGGGYVNIGVGTLAGGSGQLFVNNTDFGGNSNYDGGTLEAGSVDVKSGATLGLTLSQPFNLAANAANPYILSTNNAGSLGSIDLEGGSKLNVSFGSFVSTPGTEAAKFILFDSQNITIADPDQIRTSITSTIPFLFTGNVCAYGISGFSNSNPSACTDTPAHDQLVLTLQPKSATELGLTGYAKDIFPYANAALAADNPLGAAVISGIGSNTEAQNVYSQFAPDVTGGARALAVALTDSVSGAVGARQRALRMYAGQSSSATLWGQEYAQRFDNNGNQANGYSDNGFGMSLGVDGGSISSGRYGAALNFFSGDISEKVPALVKTSTEWYMLSGYTDWRGQGLFFDSQATVGYGNLSGKRGLSIQSSATSQTPGLLLLSRTATDKRASILASGGISTGAVLTMGSTVLMPQASLDGLMLREEGYTESGGGNGFDLRVNPYYANSLRGYLGATAREDLNLGVFYLQPQASIGYRYDFLAQAVNLKSQFIGDASNPGTEFTLVGPDPAKGSFVANAGLAATTGDWSIGFNFDYLSGGGSREQVGTITLVGRI